MKGPLEFSSDPPLRPVAVSFADGEPITIPEPRPLARLPLRAAAPSRVVAWIADAAVVAGLAAAHVALARALLAPARGWLDLLLDMRAMWVALAALLAFACSFVFVAFCGRTPGMALA